MCTVIKNVKNLLVWAAGWGRVHMVFCKSFPLEGTSKRWCWGDKLKDLCHVPGSFFGLAPKFIFNDKSHL